MVKMSSDCPKITKMILDIIYGDEDAIIYERDNHIYERNNRLYR